jgi:ribosomal protein L32
VDHLPEPGRDRGSRSRKVGRRDHRKKRQRRSHNNSDIIIAAAPDENSGAALFPKQSCRASVSDAS